MASVPTGLEALQEYFPLSMSLRSEMVRVLLLLSEISGRTPDEMISVETLSLLSKLISSALLSCNHKILGVGTPSAVQVKETVWLLLRSIVVPPSSWM